MGIPELYIKIMKRVVRNWEYLTSISNSDPVFTAS
jgi:hypothetical protein